MNIGSNHIVLSNMRDDYPHLVAHVKQNGAPTTVGGDLSYEMRNVLITLIDPYDALPLGVGLGQRFDLATAANRALRLIAGTGIELRLRWQLGSLQQLIRNDPSTRCAVAAIWDTDSDPVADDPVSTVALQFLYRDEKLSLHTTTRATDVVADFSYDAFVYTQLLLAMSNTLGCDPGTYYHHSVAFYFKAGDIGLLDYLKPTEVPSRPRNSTGLGVAEQRWDDVADRAQLLLDVAHNFEEAPTALSPSESWFLEQLVVKDV